MKDNLYEGFIELKKNLKGRPDIMAVRRTFNHIKIEGRNYAVLLELRKVD